MLFWYNSNFRAQTSVALRLLKSVEALGCRAMPSDIGMLVKVQTHFGLARKKNADDVHHCCRDQKPISYTTSGRSKRQLLWGAVVQQRAHSAAGRWPQLAGSVS